MSYAAETSDILSLMSLDIQGSDILSVIGLTIGAVFAYYGTKLTARSKKEETLPAGWQALTQEVKSWAQEQLAERDHRIESLEEREEERTAYIVWVTRVVRGIEMWAAEQGLTLPPPPLKTFSEWKADRRRPTARNPPD